MKDEEARPKLLISPIDRDGKPVNGNLIQIAKKAWPTILAIVILAGPIVRRILCRSERGAPQEFTVWVGLDKHSSIDRPCSQSGGHSVSFFLVPSKT